MHKSLAASVFGALVVAAIAAVPASAADDIESRVQVCAGCHGADQLGDAGHLGPAGQLPL